MSEESVEERVHISASILGCDLGRVVDEARSAVAAGAESIHADVMDGCFVPNISFGPALVERVVEEAHAPVTAHLMVNEPERILPDFLKTGVNRIVVHVESTPQVRRAIDTIHEAGVSPGIALNPGTPLSAAEALLPHVHEVLVMSVNPGYGGQKMMLDQLAKVRDLRAHIAAERIAELDISLDGGISPATARDARAAGASILIAGTALFGAADRPTAVRAMCGTS